MGATRGYGGLCGSVGGGGYLHVEVAVDHLPLAAAGADRGHEAGLGRDLGLLVVAGPSHDLRAGLCLGYLLLWAREEGRKREKKAVREKWMEGGGGGHPSWGRRIHEKGDLEGG